MTQKLLDVVKQLAKEELENENWLHLVARLSGRNYEQMRVVILEFLETDVFNLSPENCVSFLDPLLESWRIDLTTFGMDIVLNRRLAPGHPKKFEFVERDSDQPFEEEPGRPFRWIPMRSSSDSAFCLTDPPNFRSASGFSPWLV